MSNDEPGAGPWPGVVSKVICTWPGAARKTNGPSACVRVSAPCCARAKPAANKSASTKRKRLGTTIRGFISSPGECFSLGPADEVIGDCENLAAVARWRAYDVAAGD